jgi:hypothetical protein
MGRTPLPEMRNFCNILPFPAYQYSEVKESATDRDRVLVAEA